MALIGGIHLFVCLFFSVAKIQKNAIFSKS